MQRTSIVDTPTPHDARRKPKLFVLVLVGVFFLAAGIGFAIQLPSRAPSLEEEFSDPEFRKALQVYDLNNDGRLSEEEAAKIEELNISEDVHVIDGLQHLSDLKRIDAQGRKGTWMTQKDYDEMARDSEGDPIEGEPTDEFEKRPDLVFVIPATSRKGQNHNEDEEPQTTRDEYERFIEGSQLVMEPEPSILDEESEPSTSKDESEPGPASDEAGSEPTQDTPAPDDEAKKESREPDAQAAGVPLVSSYTYVMSHGYEVSVTAEYDDAGRILTEHTSTTVSENAASKEDTTTTYSYDGDGRLVHVKSVGDLGFDWDISWSEDGRTMSATRKMSDSSRYGEQEMYLHDSYDEEGRLLSRVWSPLPNSSAWTLEYSYDESGQLMSIVSSYGDDAYQSEATFAYDDAGRIISIVDGGVIIIIDNAPVEFTYAYDDQGNMTSRKLVSRNTESGPYEEEVSYQYEDGHLVSSAATIGSLTDTRHGSYTTYADGSVASGELTGAEYETTYVTVDAEAQSQLTAPIVDLSLPNSPVVKPSIWYRFLGMPVRETDVLQANRDWLLRHGDAETKTTSELTEDPSVEEDTTSQPAASYEAGDAVVLTGTIVRDSYEHKGTIDRLILVLDSPIDAYFGTYPNENEQTWHYGVTSVDVSDLLDAGTDIPTGTVSVSGTLTGSSKHSGAHYNENGVFCVNGGCCIDNPVLVSN